MMKWNPGTRYFLVAVMFLLLGCNALSLLGKENGAATQPSTPGNLPAKTATSLPPGEGSESIGDTYYAHLGNGGYDVAKYTISLDVDMESGEVKAVTRIEARTTQELSSFDLDFIGLTVDAVSVNNSEARFSRADRELTITPQESLQNDAAFSVEVDYHGKPEHVHSQAGDFYVGWYQGVDGTINVYTEPDGASTWFPCNNHPRDKAFYRFEITVDDPWVAAANGSLVDTTAQDGRTTYVFEMSEPMATYLATVDISTYDLETMPGPDGVLIRNYFPADFPVSLRRNFDIVPDVIEYFSSVYGPYPSTVYGFLILDEGATSCTTDPFADETQSLTITCPDPRSTGEGTIVHELSHEWFGDSVSLKNWEDLWLKEGMATYGECLWDTRGEDVQAVSACLHDFADGYETEYAVDKPPQNQLYTDEAYTGGALVFHSLRLEVGDETFFQILHTYLERYRGSYAGTDDFIALAEEVSGRDLEAKMRAWLQDPVIP
jgi:aminopeptidase N